MVIAVPMPNSPCVKPGAPISAGIKGLLNQMSKSREDSVYLAKLAEQAERYEGECYFTLREYPYPRARSSSSARVQPLMSSQRWSRT